MKKMKKKVKWRLGKAVPPQMPQGKAMQEVEKQIQEITDKEVDFCEKKKLLTLHLFSYIVTIALLFSYMIAWMFYEGYDEAGVSTFVVGAIALITMRLMLRFSAAEANWKNARKKNITNWMVAAFFLINILSFFVL